MSISLSFEDAWPVQREKPFYVNQKPFPRHRMFRLKAPKQKRQFLILGE